MVEVDVKKNVLQQASESHNYDINVVCNILTEQMATYLMKSLTSMKNWGRRFNRKSIRGALGSGDTFYDKFCQSVLDFDAQFAKTGAKKGAENVLVDLNAEAEDIEHIQAFAQSLVEALA